MKKTFELLMDVKVVKKSVAFSSLLSLFFVIVIVICLKLGIDRWKTYDDPMTWSELYLKLPHIVFFGIGLFVIFFFAALHNKEGGSSYFVCTRCLNVYYHYQIKKDECPDCCSKVEKMAGFYDRHPELKKKKRRKIKL